MIHPNDRVSSVLARDEGLIEVFVSASPAFAMLRNKVSRRTMAKLVNIEQAARIAGIETSVLLTRLNEALQARGGGAESPEGASPAAVSPAGSPMAGLRAPTAPANEVPASGAAAIDAPSGSGLTPEPEPAPPGLFETPADRLVELDVREELRAGKEPFRLIFDAARGLAPEQILRLRAIFEPAPLYAVLGRLGLAHYTERLAADDWRVWFYRDAGAASTATTAGADEAPPPMDPDEAVVVLDVRDLEPPEPMVQTLEALASLPRGKTLVQINQRVPQFLLPKLEERGFTYEIREQSPSLVRIFIQHRD